MQHSFMTAASLTARQAPKGLSARTATIDISSSTLAEISAIEAGLLPPARIASELTGVPPAVTSALVDKTALLAIQSSIIANGIPGWFSSLPPDGNPYVPDIEGPLSSAYEEISSLKSELTATIGSTIITVTATSVSVIYSDFPNTSRAQSSTTSTPSQIPSSSLSSGARAGIGAGVALGVVAILVALMLFWRRRRRSLQTVPHPPSNFELDDTKGHNSNRQTVVELANKQLPAELAYEDRHRRTSELQ